MRAIFLVLLGILAGCTVGPDYQKPAQKAPDHFKERSLWQPAEPSQPAVSEAWWQLFQDPILDQLETQLAGQNPGVQAAEAAYRGAVAAAAAANAAFFPALSLNGSGQRAQVSNGSAHGSRAVSIGNQFAGSVGASWDLDLWGRLRRSAEAADASQQASAADLASVKLAQQAALAADYFALRAADQLIRLLENTVTAYTATLRISKNQYAAGTASQLDVAQAETQLAATRAQSIAAGNQRAQLEHAIAALVGMSASEFAIPPVTEDLVLPPEVPGILPAKLLERRPDIAAAERRMAAANAEIGVATAAYYPDISLSGSFGSTASMLSQLMRTSNQVWSLGAQSSLSLFDGGLHNAELAQAQAGYDQEVAVYRQAVLSSFQQIEDQLAAHRILADQALAEDKAVAASAEALRLSTNQYKAGTVAYTTVVTAQTAALATQQTALAIRQNRLTATVALIQALGGGWTGLAPRNDEQN
ncbi:MAG TPA: efflux transporter outer membrane subunit [Rhodospirillaceae bacterium]|nr:efflux transporter outer membrane subunit [Rhodospirillaceae bacterium]